jgi:hypothetical protein
MNANTGSIQRAIVGRGWDMEWFDTMPGERMALRVHSREVGGAFTIVEARVPPLSGPPVHLHKDREEIFEVLDGEFRRRGVRRRAGHNGRRAARGRAWMGESRTATVVVAFHLRSRRHRRLLCRDRANLAGQLDRTGAPARHLDRWSPDPCQRQQSQAFASECLADQSYKAWPQSHASPSRLHAGAPRRSLLARERPIWAW